MSAGMIPCTALFGILSLLLMTSISTYACPERLRQGLLGFVPGAILTSTTVAHVELLPCRGI